MIKCFLNKLTTKLVSMAPYPNGYTYNNYETTSKRNEVEWQISHSYLDMLRGRRIENKGEYEADPFSDEVMTGFL